MFGHMDGVKPLFLYKIFRLARRELLGSLACAD